MLECGTRAELRPSLPWPAGTTVTPLKHRVRGRLDHMVKNHHCLCAQGLDKKADGSVDWAVYDFKKGGQGWAGVDRMRVGAASR
jgi:hypothetical protein